MSTATDTHHDADTHGSHELHGSAAVKHAIVIFVVLALITALEVALSYADVGALFLPALLILMAIKFVLVVLEFMHLRHDGKWFNMAFWSGLGLALIVYLAAVSTFHVFGS